MTVRWRTGAPVALDRPVLGADSAYADGMSLTTVTVVARDAAGAPAPGGTVVFSATGQQPLLGRTVDHGDGTYSAQVVASASRGAATIVARLADQALTSEGVVFAQVARPQVTTPADGAVALDPLGGVGGGLAIAGTADLLTTAVDVGCVTSGGFQRLGGSANGVVVADGQWSVTGESLPGILFNGVLCRLIAVPSGVLNDSDATTPGPRLRRLWVNVADPSAAQSFSAAAGGLDGEASVRALGTGCSVTLRTVDPLFIPSWLTCGAQLPTRALIGSEPNLLVDGVAAFSAGFAATSFGGIEGAPRFVVSRSVDPDGSLVVQERGPLARCGEPCDTLVPAGVELTVRTRMAPSGQRLSQALLYRSTDGAAHDVRVTLQSRTAYTTPQFRFGAESEWTPRTAQETVAASGERYSVLMRDGSAATRPAIALTAMPAPSEQTVANSRVNQRYVRAVPADGAQVGVGLIFDLVAPETVESAAAQAREAFDVEVAIAPPASGETSAASVVVTGTASDGAGPVGLRVGGEPVVVAADGSWSATVPLALGVNEIEAVVASPFGPRATDTVSVTRVAPPEEPETPEQPGEPGAAGGSGTPGTGGGSAAPGGAGAPGGGGSATPPAPTPGGRTAPAALARLTAPRLARLAGIRRRGLAVTVTLTAPARVTATVRGPGGRFAAAVRAAAKRGTLTLRLKPSPRAAARVLHGRRSATLRLAVAVRAQDGRTATLTRTIRLVR